ncbi:MAG: protein O-mannosyl-transferase family [Syntrophothermus sp.]
MHLYKRINTLLGWAVFIIASTVYILTSEPTMSYWDCGEYISTAFKLEVGHPPGAPLFQLIGRFFSLFAFGNVTLVARMVNTMSALSSGFTILFLFWSITMIAKKIMLRNNNEMTRENMFTIMGAGLIGSLAYTFTDSFWFSAVEGEVYAMSSFFTAVVFWAILKWDEKADEPGAVRYLLLIAYLVGLSIGVHLLNLLAIPAITFVYYFRKYNNHNWKSILVTLAISILILASVMYFIIPGILDLAGWFERAFVNGLGLPFNTGTIFYFILLIGGIVFGIIYTRKKNKPVWNAIVLAITFIIIGYTSFIMLVIRSNANTPIDENNPENAMYLLSYMNREQYGDWPLLKGPYYNAPVIERKDGNPVYTKDSAAGKYVITDKKEMSEPVYDPRFTTIFPRMWCNYEQQYIEEYKRWGQVHGVPVEVSRGGQTETLYKPTFGENLTFFTSYQLIHMYYRYFMWNFTGRQNDAQGLGNKINGNWKSGIKFIDQARLGKHKVPEMRHSRADNSFYFLPLILGIIGLWYTLKRDKRQALIIGLLFLFTGLAIVIYLNQYAPQPLERDYAYAGSFYAFAIWIGLAIPQITLWINRYTRWMVAHVIAIAIGLITVVIMGQQGWDDHDRSGRYTALATAKNYLNSCAPNAILFTNGDNDTFPLWYAQEVEGIRTDVRVINLSLLNTDWYIDQLKRQAYDGLPVPFSLTQDKYRQGHHDVTYLIEDTTLQGYVGLKDIFDIIQNDESRLKLQTQQFGMVDFLPTKKFAVGIDSNAIVSEKRIPEKYFSKMGNMLWEPDKQAFEKNDLMMMDLLAHNDWKRPVYYVMTMGPDAYLGLENYLFLEGLAYRLLPVNTGSKEGSVNTDVMYDNLMNKFTWGNLNNPKITLDDQSQRMVMNFRMMFGRLSGALIAEGKTDSARKVMDKCLEIMPDNIVPYDYFSLGIAEDYLKTGDRDKALKIINRTGGYLKEDLAYLFSFSKSDYPDMDVSFREDLMSLQKILEIARTNFLQEVSREYEPVFQQYYQGYMDNVYKPQ